MPSQRAASSRRRIAPILLLASIVAHAEDGAVTDVAAPEFLDFLEYLGSWEDGEQDWVQFLDGEDADVTQDAVGPPAEEAETEDDDDVVS
jgi:hypothetical protein